MNKLLNVSSSPHVRSGVTTKNIMYDVAIAMIPATVWGVMQFGLYSLLVVAATVLSCVLSEYVFEVLMKKPVTLISIYRKRRIQQGKKRIFSMQAGIFSLTVYRQQHMRGSVQQPAGILPGQNVRDLL